MCGLVVEVSSRPGEPDPPASLQLLIPVPDALSAHEKLLATTCPTAYTPPDAGELIDAVGAAAGVWLIVIDGGLLASVVTLLGSRLPVQLEPPPPPPAPPPAPPLPPPPPP